MRAIPTQRETVPRGGEPSAHPPAPAPLRATLAGGSLAPGAARGLLVEAMAEWAASGMSVPARLAENAVLVVSELVTNAVVHAGTAIGLVCRVDAGAVVVEVSDHRPGRSPFDGRERGRGLRLVALLAESWGVTHRGPARTVWARLVPDGGTEDPADECRADHGDEEAGDGFRDVTDHDADFPDGTRCGDDLGSLGHAGHGDACADSPDAFGPDVQPYERYGSYEGYGPYERYGPYEGYGLYELYEPPELSGPSGRPGRGDREWLNRGALSFLAEASDLLAGQLDEDLVAALTGQLLVPRLADWCAVWLEDEVGGRGWGDGTAADGRRLARVRHGDESRVDELRRALEKDPPKVAETPLSGPAAHPWPGEALGVPGAALAYRLIAGGRPLGTLVIGRAGLLRFPDEITGLVEDLSRRVALAIGAARQYARQVTISAVLQRGLLPGAVAEIPGVRSALVYEPSERGGPSGDFYDLFPAGNGRWCFAVGDVQGKGPEAAVVIGLARPWLRLLAREGYGVADVLDRLNQLLLDDATEAADAAARAFVGPAGPVDGPQTRFLSLLYGELVPFPGGVRCTLASAGHPLPLILGPDGDVRTAAQPQTLLGVVEDVTYTSETLDLRTGESLLCVTDGVTERRSGSRQFDDGDGLAHALAACAGLDAERIAERIRQQVHDFGLRPPEDDLALLVLQAE